MQTSMGRHDPMIGGSFAARSRERGHATSLSISDDSHHVTETIGFLYGDDDERDPRRISNARSSQYSDLSTDGEEVNSTRRSSFPRKAVARASDSINGQQIPHPSRGYSLDKENGQTISPGAVSREQSPSETAQTHFPLNDIDYESSPAAVAQELSNLQALRRMSMDVHAAGDPDLPTFNPAAIPMAPSPTTSDDDSARLFWVPARLHPELAPKEFKTFLEGKAEQIKRRSGDLSSLRSSPMSSRSGSINSNSSSLSRKKSMLSREVNNSAGYQDGADILERKRSASHSHHPSDPNLAELESLVANNLQLNNTPTPVPDENADFILPSVPSSSLKRSTKTKYQRGGGIKGRGDRSQRSLKRAQTPEQPAASDAVPPIPSVPAISSSGFSSEPSNLADSLAFSSAKPTSSTQNFSRPAARSPSPQQDNAANSIPANTFDSILGGSGSGDWFSQPNASESRTWKQPQSQTERQSVPQIIETPPTDDHPSWKAQGGSSQSGIEASQPASAQHKHPERTSSRETPPKNITTARPPMPRTHASAGGVPTKSSRVDVPPIAKPKQSLDQPSPLPGVDTNTSNLSFIPTLTVDKQSQEQQKSKKSGWGWLLGKDDDKDKSKGRSGKHADNTRLDVLQTSIDGSSRRRETIEIDRDSLKLEEERRKESYRKTSTGDKKEKESFISSLFGGKRSKAEREAKKSPRLSPEPPYRELKPDIDYSWTRFSILEERAIYRMAHIKLANPRRPLYSQVLLSNFMYSYLAKVQQMHPQMNLPTNAKQQKKQKEQSTQQPEEFATYQRYQQQQEQQQTVQPAPTAHREQQQQQPLTYEGQYSSESYEQNNSRPSTRGSARSTESGYSNTGYGNGNSYTYNRQQQPVQQYETDRENETW